jgi:CheY-like chemotaxis protein
MSQTFAPAPILDEPGAGAAAPCGGTALVVDDAPVDRRLTGALVERTTGLKAVYAANGLEALEVLKREAPAVVLTDLRMPQMDGLQLVEQMRVEHPGVPVVLITAVGSEETAIAALRGGAVSYVPKRNQERELRQVLPQVLAAARVDRRRQQLLECLTHLDCRFVLGNDPALVPVLVAHLQEHVARLGLCDANGKIRLGVALEEALLNGLLHGNLEVGPELRQDGLAFHRLAQERRGQAPYRDRRLHVHFRLSPDEATFVIRDEGPGFDPSQLPDPTDPEGLLEPGGRGLLLIRTFMDEVRHNAKGNEITLVKRREASGGEAPRA